MALNRRKSASDAGQLNSTKSAPGAVSKEQLYRPRSIQNLNLLNSSRSVFVSRRATRSNSYRSMDLLQLPEREASNQDTFGTQLTMEGTNSSTGYFTSETSQSQGTLASSEPQEGSSESVAPPVMSISSLLEQEVEYRPLSTVTNGAATASIEVARNQAQIRPSFRGHKLKCNDCCHIL